MENHNQISVSEAREKIFYSEEFILKILSGDFVIYVPCDIAFKIISDVY